MVMTEPRLLISLLGGFQCMYGEENVTERLGGRAQSLLAFLLLHRMTPQSRHYVAFTLWPDSIESQARTNLRYVLHALRQTFPPIERHIVTGKATLQWQCQAGATLDVAELENALATARTAPDAATARQAMEQALALYRGDLLPGLYEDWVTVHRETLRSGVLTTLAATATRIEQAGLVRDALELRRRLLALDPLDEPVYVDLMRLYGRLGDRAAVKRTFDACVAMLRKELDVEASAVTQAALREYLTLDADAFVVSDEAAEITAGAPVAATPKGMVVQGAADEAGLHALGWAAQAPNPHMWIAQTKIQPPQLRPDLARRPRLEEALVEAFRTQALSLLCAPAGYGKTTLLATAARQAQQNFGPVSQPALQGEAACAWLSMDLDDDDPQLFFYGLVAALQQLSPRCGVDALAALEAADDPATGLRRVMGILINEIVEHFRQPAVLVLDDLHVVTNPVVHQFLAGFLDRIPATLHVAIGVRFEPPLPWARWRANQRLAEFNADDLAFRLEETALLLNERLRLGLSAQDLTALHTRTEGWAAGLRLLAGSLVTVPAYAERSAFIDHLTEGGRHVFDLLAEEVLRRQEPQVQTFLLQTAILPVLTPALCEAVTGRPDAGAVLAELYRRNLFLVQLGTADSVAGSGNATGDTAGMVALAGEVALRLGGPAAYRYHALFAEFLQNRLRQQPQDVVADLYRRAALASPNRAISFYMQGGLWAEAADTLEYQGESLLRQGLAGLMARWIDALPQALYTSRPGLLYLRGVCAWMAKRPEQAEMLLSKALAGFEATDNRTGQGAALAYLAQLAFIHADFHRGLELVARALDYPIDVPIHIQLLLERARIAQFQSDFEAGVIDVRTAYGLVQATRTPETIQAMLDGYVPGFAGMPGGLDELNSLCRLAELVMLPHNKVLEGLLYEQRLVLWLTRGDLARACQAGEQALSLGERLSGRPVWQHRVTKMLTLVAQRAAGNRPRAEKLIEQLLHEDRLLVQDEGVTLHPVSGILYLYAHSCWRAGRADILAQTYMLLAPLKQERIGDMTRLSLLMLDAIWHMHQAHYAQALAILQEAAALEQAIPMHNLFGSAHTLAACVHNRLGDPAAAQIALNAAFEDCARQSSYGRMLIERPELDELLYAAQSGTDGEQARELLSRIARLEVAVPDATALHIDAPNARLHAILSPREQEVLALLASGAGNQAIAETLVISIHTVKRHVAHILEKLNLASRAEAIAYYHATLANGDNPPPAA